MSLASGHGEPEKAVLPPRNVVAIGDCSVIYSTYYNPKNTDDFCTVSATNSQDGSCCGVVAHNACSSNPKFAQWKKSTSTDNYDSQCFRKTK